jgi:hypothetical protein
MQGAVVSIARTPTHNKLQRSNGRSKAENVAYAKIAQAGLSAAQRAENARKARETRIANLAAEIDPEGLMDPADRMAEVNRVLNQQLLKARAARLTARRKAAEAAERLAETEAELAAFDDAG